VGAADVALVSVERPPSNALDLWAIGLILVVGLALRSSVVPASAHTWFNLALLGAVALLALASGMDRTELGLDQRHLGAGVRWGGAAAGIVVVAVVVAALLPAFAGAFDDDRVDVGVDEMLLRALVVIPLATVALEELAFRGVLLASLLRRARTLPAVVWSSVAFGFWHVPGAWKSASDNAVLGGVAVSTAGRLGVVLGTVVVTSVAGLVFAWLRVRSRSLVAPMLLHVATNVTPFVAAWTLAR
jgi:uncharacterized protein